MFREYAVEPSVISSWERARFFLDAFGPSKGRFLAPFPGQWRRMVYEALDCGDLEKKRIEDRLARLDKRAFSRRPEAKYDGALPWLVNAEVEHARLPFHAVVAVGPATRPYVLTADDVDDSHDSWRLHPGLLVARTPEAYASSLQVLLRTSRRTALVDPYFRSDHVDKTAALAAICRAVPPGGAVEVHFSESKLAPEFSMAKAQQHLPRILPAGTKVVLYCWKERPGGARFHNRYILTDLGGVKFGDGIEEGEAGQEDHLSILDQPSWETLLAQYTDPSSAFDLAGGPREFSS